MTGTRLPPTLSKSHRKGSGFQGSPVVPMSRSAERSWLLTQSAPYGMSARTAVGEMPRWVTRWRSQSAQRRSGFG